MEETTSLIQLHRLTRYYYRCTHIAAALVIIARTPLASVAGAESKPGAAACSPPPAPPKASRSPPSCAAPQILVRVYLVVDLETDTVQSQRPGPARALPVALCLHTHPAAAPLAARCTPASSVFASIESPLPAPSLASLIAVLAEGASVCSGSHYSNPTLPRPTLPDQIYRATAAGQRGPSLSSHRCISPLTPPTARARRHHSPASSIARPRPSAFLASRHHRHRLHCPPAWTTEEADAADTPDPGTSSQTHMTIVSHRPSRSLQASLFLALKSRSSTALKTTTI